MDVDIKAGQAMWFADVTHSEENIGKTDGELLIVEIKKRPSPDADAAKWADSLGSRRGSTWESPGRVEERTGFACSTSPCGRGEDEPLHMHRMPSVLYILAEDDIQDFDVTGNPSNFRFWIWFVCGGVVGRLSVT
jgi:hypothetical protein